MSQIKGYVKIDLYLDLLSSWFLTKLCTKTWYLFINCVTTRLLMEIVMFFCPEKCKEIGKIGEIVFVFWWSTNRIFFKGK